MNPHLEYYHACVGAWAGPTTLRVTSFSSLRASAGLVNVLSFWTMALVSAWLGGLRLHTTVRFEAEHTVVHTTTARWFGVPLLKGQETIQLDADGHTFTLDGESRTVLMPWRKHPVSGRVEVLEGARSARYALQFMGGPLTQETTRTQDAVTLTQWMPGYEAIHRLARC